MDENGFAAPVPNLLLRGSKPSPVWIQELLVRFLGPYDWAKEGDDHGQDEN